MMKRIKVVVPVSSDMWNASVKELMERYKDPDTELQVVNIEKGPESLECTYDEVLAEMFTLLEAEKAQDEGFDGVIIYCGSDPGLRAAREKLVIPAVGLGESSYHLASLLGTSFSIITVGPPDLVATQCRRVRDHLKVYALEHKCASVRSVAIPVIDLEKEKAKQEERLFTEVRRAIEEDGADTIVLGCGGMFRSQKSNRRRRCGYHCTWMWWDVGCRGAGFRGIGCAGDRTRHRGIEGLRAAHSDRPNPEQALFRNAPWRQEANPLAVYMSGGRA